jgi:hypothetical protein
MENFERANAVLKNTFQVSENRLRFVHGAIVGMLKMLNRRWKGRIHFRWGKGKHVILRLNGLLARVRENVLYRGSTQSSLRMKVRRL